MWWCVCGCGMMRGARGRRRSDSGRENVDLFGVVFVMMDVLM